MFSKILKIATPIILIGIILFIAYSTYQKTQSSIENPVTVIPTNASVILKFNDVRGQGRLLTLSTIWNKLQNISRIELSQKQIKKISKFFTENQTTFPANSLFISFHKVGANNSATLFSTTFNRKLIASNNQLVALFNDDFTTSEYDNQSIYFSKTLNRYFSFKGDILFFSTSKMLVTDAIRTSNENTDNLFVNTSFEASYSTISSTADINLLINYNHLAELSSIFTKNNTSIYDFSDWIATDIKLKNNVILANGIGNINSTITNFTDIFNNQKAQDINIVSLLPENTTQLLAISFSNAKKIYNNKNKILQNQNSFWSWDKNRKQIQDSCNVNYNEIVNEIDNEAGMFNTSSTLNSDNIYTYFNVKEPVRALSLMQGLISTSSDYKEFRINTIRDSKLTANLFGDLFKADNNFFTTINDYLIFGNSKTSLEYIIDNYKSKNTLSNNNSFKNFSSYFSDDANLFYYIRINKTVNALKNKLENEFAQQLKFNPDSISQITFFSVQFSAKKNLLMNNISLYYDEDYKEAIKEEWYFPLDTNTNMSPQFVNNHFTGEQMILIQDNFNKLFAIDSDGIKLWELQLAEKILGDINFIDIYKNKKYQAIFNTKSQLHLLDRNGRNVEGYPKNLPISTSFGHSLFDYSKNKKYRIIIVGDDNKLYNIDTKGRRVNGWKYSKTTNRIKQSPTHFIIDDKDYISNITNNSTTKLLARNGTDRIVFKDAETFANQVQISDKGVLYAITNEGKLWNGNVNGTSTTYEIPNLNTTSKILAHNGGYYIANENTLSFTNDAKTINIKSPILTITKSNDFIILTTDIELYLIKDKEIIEGFPIASDGLFKISDIDNDEKINIVNIKNGFIYNYELDN